jgi:hypothetical protein
MRVQAATRLLALGILAGPAMAQNENSIWIFGDSAGIDFSNMSGPVPYFSVMDGRGSCVSISDSSGNLILYSYTSAKNGDWSTAILNSLHDSVSGADSITGAGWYNELALIPLPDSDSLFYLFSVGLDEPNNNGLFYTLIDMNQNGGAGQVVLQNIQLDSKKRADCLQAVKHGDGRDWWIISKLSNNSGSFKNRFYVYLVTPFGISDSVSYFFNNATDFDTQNIVFNSDGSQFIQQNIRGFMCEYDFDRCTGIISNPKVIYPEQTGSFNRYFWDGAYSPNDSLFYCSTIGYIIGTAAFLLQFNLQDTNIALSCDTLDTFYNPIGTGSVRLAPDKKIYFSRAYECPGIFCFPYPDSVYNIHNMNLSVINHPDSLGAACDYQPFSFYLGGKRTYYGLPNNPNYNLGPLAGSPCDTLTGVETMNAHSGATLFLTYAGTWEKLYVNAQGLKGSRCQLQIVDMNGREVFGARETTHPPYFTHTVHVASFASGLYVVSLVTEKESLRKKFVKQ